MTPSYADLVNPTFNYVLGLLERVEQGERPDMELERNTIREEIEQAQLTASSPDHPVKAEEFALTKQLLVYWVDEVMTAAPSEEVAEWWSRHTLEYEYYNEQLRAIKFYTAGERGARRSSADVVEAWYLALVLGFEGDPVNAFREHLNRELPGQATTAEEARKNWAAELARQIRQSQVADLHADPLEGDVRPLTGVSRLIIAAPLAVVLLVAFCALLVLCLRGN